MLHYVLGLHFSNLKLSKTLEKNATSLHFYPMRSVIKKNVLTLGLCWVIFCVFCVFFSHFIRVFDNQH